MITAMLWIVLASGHATEPILIEGMTCKEAAVYLKEGGWKLSKGSTLYCAEGYGV